MSEWKIAMLCIIPLMAFGAHISFRSLLLPKPRAWLAVFLSSVMAAFFAFRPEAYLAIDLFFGGLVLARPAGIAQKAIGLIFAGMAVVDIGYVISPRLDGGLLFYWVLSVLGWVQFSILAAWGSYDLGRHVFSRLGLDRHPLVTGASVR